MHCRDNNTRKRRELGGEGCYFHASLSPWEQDRGAWLELPKKDLWSQQSGMLKSLEQTAASPLGMQSRECVRLALVTGSHERLDFDSMFAPARPHWQCQIQAVHRLLVSQRQCNHYLKKSRMQTRHQNNSNGLKKFNIPIANFHNVTLKLSCSCNSLQTETIITVTYNVIGDGNFLFLNLMPSLSLAMFPSKDSN